MRGAVEDAQSDRLDAAAAAAAAAGGAGGGGRADADRRAADERNR